MAVRLWWADDTDLFLTSKKLEKLKSDQFKDWEWIKWTSETDDNDAFLAMATLIGLPSMFEEGKVVYCFGLPKFHAKLAEELQNIPDKVLFIIIARPNKTLTIFKEALKLQEQGLAKVDIPFEMPKDRNGRPTEDAYSWVQARAKQLGTSIDDEASRLLVDLMGFEPNILTMELKRLSFLENPITPWGVQSACYGEGEGDIFMIGNAILSGNGTKAKSILTRLLASGEPPIKICGYLTDWVRKMAIAENLGRDTAKLDKFKPLLASLKKRPEKANSPISIIDFNEGNGYKECGKLFANPASMFFALNELCSSNRYKNWAYEAVLQLGRLQIALRRQDLPDEVLMMDFIDKLVADRPEGLPLITGDEYE